MQRRVPELKRVVIANFYPVWPPMGGGQRRIFFLARELSKVFDVELMVVDRMGVNKTTKFTQTFRETRVAVEARFRNFEHALEKRVKFSADIAYAMHWSECILYNELLAERAEAADVLITAHPYSMYALQKARLHRDVPIVFDSQNVELHQKAPLLGDNEDMLNALRQIEATALTASERVIACSREDAVSFGEEYGVDSSNIAIIENGVDALGVPHVPEDIRNCILDSLGFRDKLVSVFGGSLHFPNLKAVDRILDFARVAPDMVFLILGSVCNCDRLRAAVPSNVITLGEVDESVKWVAFAISDIGLNPMELGSGTNIKMFEYGAAGLAPVSSLFGARGIDLKPEENVILCDLDEMGSTLAGMSVADRRMLSRMGESAKDAITATADWSVIGQRYISLLKEIIQ